MKNYWKPISYLSSILLLLILITVFVWHEYFMTDSFFTPAITLTTDTAFHFPIYPIYLQNDPRWKDDKIGGSQETMGEVGCFVSGISMALAHHGIDLNPKLLNELLKANDGYTKQGWVKWQAVSKITYHKVGFHVPSQPRFAVIDAALEAGEPILAKIRLSGRFPHWVLIVGKAGQDYLVKDPLGDGESLDKLSKFNSKIYAIRVVKKIETEAGINSYFTPKG